MEELGDGTWVPKWKSVGSHMEEGAFSLSPVSPFKTISHPQSFSPVSSNNIQGNFCGMLTYQDTQLSLLCCTTESRPILSSAPVFAPGKFPLRVTELVGCHRQLHRVAWERKSNEMWQQNRRLRSILLLQIRQFISFWGWLCSVWRCKLPSKVQGAYGRLRASPL
jgi:hypothetical protein